MEKSKRMSFDFEKFKYKLVLEINEELYKRDIVGGVHPTTKIMERKEASHK